MNRYLAILCSILLVSGNTFLFADPAPAAQDTPQTAALTPDQLNSLVAPIALYPDELVSQILVASTYPLEIVQANQWMQQHTDLKGQDLTAAAQKQSWDPSIQALVAFPDVLKRLNQDVTWTTNLGNAFLANQGNVMDAIQKMRVRAQDAGKLKSTEQQNVVNTTENGQAVVEIEPARPEVVYVPDYDPAWIWGPAPEYYPYPYWYYPPAPPFGVWCWWGGGIVLGSVFLGWHGWGGWGWHPGWGGRTIIVNNGFIRENHFNAVRVTNVHGATVWAHSPDHRLGVSYPNRALAQHFNAGARPAFNHVTVNQARQQFSQSATRVRAAGGADRMGSRQIGAGVYNHNRSAFGGMEAGSNARMHSTRGYSSLGHARAGGSVGHGGGGVSSGGGHGGGEGHESGGGGGGGGGHR